MELYQLSQTERRLPGKQWVRCYEIIRKNLLLLNPAEVTEEDDIFSNIESAIECDLNIYSINDFGKFRFSNTLYRIRMSEKMWLSVKHLLDINE